MKDHILDEIKISAKYKYKYLSTTFYRLRTNEKQNPEAKNDDYLENPQVYRHTLMGIFMVCSMIAGILCLNSNNFYMYYVFNIEITLPFWAIVSDSIPPTGIFKIMKFLTTVLNSGHGILIFTVFILDVEDLFKLLRKWGLAIKEKIDEIKKEREIKERKKSATGQFVQMVIRQNNMVTNSMYQ